MWQEIIVYTILAAALGVIIHRVWVRFTCKPDAETGKCDNCIGCSLKELKKK